MNNNGKKILKKYKWMKIKYMLVCFLGLKRCKYLKKNNIFGELGDNVLFQPTKLPNNPKLIKIHNNVKIAADVTFYEHDVINQVFRDMDENIEYNGHLSCIEIYDNVFIGGKSILIGDLKIGPNAIVAAGSVVTKDVEPGTIVGGNPAVVIGKFDALHEKRKKIDIKEKNMNLENRYEEAWRNFYNKRKR